MYVYLRDRYDRKQFHLEFNSIQITFICFKMINFHNFMVFGQAFLDNFMMIWRDLWIV